MQQSERRTLQTPQSKVHVIPPKLDYAVDLNHNETFLQTTTFLPEDFTYFPNHTCPERLPSMSEYYYDLHFHTACFPILAQRNLY